MKTYILVLQYLHVKVNTFVQPPRSYFFSPSSTHFILWESYSRYKTVSPTANVFMFLSVF